MPNPLEVGGQLQGCKDMAAQFGLDTTNVFYAGHSLGGIVLENYVSGNLEMFYLNTIEQLFLFVEQ